MSRHISLASVLLLLVLFSGLLADAKRAKHGRRVHHRERAPEEHREQAPEEHREQAPAKFAGKTPEAVAREVAKLLNNKDMTERDLTPDEWTDCSTDCGGGTRSDTAGQGWTIACNTFSCGFNISCSCGEADMVFMLDSSGSVSEEFYWVSKQFLLDVVSGLGRLADQNSRNTRFAAIYYGSDALVAFDFSDGYTLSNVAATNDAIWAIPYLSSLTNTEGALREAATIFNTQGIKGTKRVAILLSDGKSNSNPIPAADDLKAQGVAVYTIGIGSVDSNELMGIASDPDNLYYYYVNDFDSLPNIIEQVLDGSCCYSVAPDCSTTSSGSCSVSCGGGIQWAATTCVYEDYLGNVIHTEVFNETQNCCEIPCPPSTQDCKNCNFTNNVGYMQDPANCHCYYQCEILGPDSYRHFHMCCPDTLFWNQAFETCAYTQLPGCIVPPYENCETNPWNTPPPTGTVLPTTTTPCRYTQNPNDPSEYMLGGVVIGSCGSGLIWSEEACTCVPGGSGQPCEGDVLLHFPFDDAFNDVSCMGAFAEIHGQPVLTSNGMSGNAASFSGSDFLTVPAMNNYLAGRSVTTWSVSVWFFRQGATDVYMGLTNNGDCVQDPSWTVFVTPGSGVSAGVGTWDTQATVRLPDVTVVSNAWVHTVMVYDGASLKLYVDGTLQVQTAITGSLVNRHCPMAIGIEGTDGYPGQFTGYIDELRVYERALSASEVQDLYNNP